MSYFTKNMRKVLAAVEPNNPLTSKQISKKIGKGKHTTHVTLLNLANRGLVETETVDIGYNRAHVFYTKG